MNDRAQKNKGGDQIERLLFDAVFQDCKDTVDVGIIVAFKAARKGLGVIGRLFRCQSPCPSG